MTIDDPTRTARLEGLLTDGLAGPESAFGITSIDLADDGGVRTSMPPGAVPLGVDGLPAAGAVGVLADDALGFALISSSRKLAWSVSVEIHLDFLAVLPADSRLHAVGHGTDVDGLAAYAWGEVRDDTGRTVVAARQHGRYVPAPHSAPRAEWRHDAAPARDVLSLLGATVSAEGAEVVLVLEEPGRFLNPVSAVHGGVAICAVEAAATYATLDSAVPLRTTSVTIAYPRPMPGDGPVSFHARQVHAGRTLRIVEVVGVAAGRRCTLARVVRQAMG